MTVKELIELLSKCSPDKTVWIEDNDFYLFTINSIVESKDKVLISNYKELE